MKAHLFQLIVVLVFATGASCIDVVVQPQSAIVKEGDNITLRCEFDEPVNKCAWTRSQDPVQIGGRYQYSNANANGKNTTNCSLSITAFKHMDATSWKCFHYIKLDEPSASRTTYLTMASAITAHPENDSVLEGGYIILKCKFNKIIRSCAWFQNGNAIEIKYRYKFISSDELNGKNTSDCSILINEFSQIDATYWYCSNVVTYDYGVDNCTSKFAYLTLKIPEENATLPMMVTDTSISNSSADVDVHPQNVSSFFGGNVLLKCTFKEVIRKCVWLRNGTALQIKDRYKYYDVIATGENTTNCSIEISQFQQIDAIRWQCSCAATSNIIIETCTSNYAYLTMNQSDVTTESPKRSNNGNDKEFSLELNSSSLINYILSGTLVIIIIIGAIIFCLRRMNKGKKQENSQLKSVTADASQGPSGPEYHEYTYITTQQDTSKEDAMGYLVPKDATIDTNKPEIEYKNHIYDKIPE